MALNLLTNAMRYAAESPHIDVGLRTENGWAVYEVRDFRPGISAQHLPRLFDRFYQVDRAQGSAGLGVGLFITRELVQAHGGEIAIASEDGQGATCVVRLPPREAPQPSPAEQR